MSRALFALVALLLGAPQKLDAEQLRLILELSGDEASERLDE